MPCFRLWLWLVWLVALVSPTLGQQVGGDSYLHMKITDNSIQAQWGIALLSFDNVRVLDCHADGKIGHDKAQERLGMMADYALARLALSTENGVCVLQPGEHEVVGRSAIIRIHPRCPLPLAALTIDYRLFVDVDPLHRGLLRLEHQDRTHTGIFTPQQPTQKIRLVEARRWHQFLVYVVEGIWHIWIGSDHILFLMALLLPAVLERRGRRWEPVTSLRAASMNVLNIGTSFTIAHSLTLGAAVLGLITPPIRLIESIIAISVVVAALNNLWPFIPAKRMVALTFGFGLIHGFGFANVLQELGLPRGALALMANPETALEAYSRAVDLNPQSWPGWISFTSMLRHLGEHAKAESSAQRALELTQVTNDPSLIGMAYEHLGATYQAGGKWEEAEGMYRDALNTYRVLGDEPRMARVYQQIGMLYSTLGRFDKAQAMYRDALSIHQRSADQEGMAFDYASLGIVYAARGLFEQAESMYHEALKLNDALDRQPRLALVYADLGRLSQRRGDGPQAELNYRQALAIDETLNYQPGIASHATSLGMVYRQGGDLERAAAMFRQAISVDEALGHQLGLAINYANLASVYQMQGDLEAAEALYHKALDHQ